MCEWKTIDSAPKDGTSILVCHLISHPSIVFWRKIQIEYHHEKPEGWYTISGNRSVLQNPTHWMPLPTPPKPSPASSEGEG
jgi:hypothetical protein